MTETLSSVGPDQQKLIPEGSADCIRGFRNWTQNHQKNLQTDTAGRLSDKMSNVADGDRALDHLG